MSPRRAKLRAFTLIEIMMVVAIIGLVATMGVPAILTAMRQSPLRQAVNDTMQICSNARAQAILSGKPVTVVFHPLTREVAIAAATDTDTPDNPFPSDAPPENPPPAAGSNGSKTVNATQFDNSIAIETLDINLKEYKDLDEARVRFFPNGTSDELTLILSSGNQYRKISLEVMTGLASVEVMK